MIDNLNNRFFKQNEDPEKLMHFILHNTKLKLPWSDDDLKQA